MISKNNFKFTGGECHLAHSSVKTWLPDSPLQQLFSLKQCIVKQLLHSVFVISGIMKVSASADNTYLDPDCSEYHIKLRRYASRTSGYMCEVC